MHWRASLVYCHNDHYRFDDEQTIWFDNDRFDDDGLKMNHNCVTAILLHNDGL